MKIVALLIGIIFLVLAVLTATGAARFAPAIGVDGLHHVKHTLLYAVIAALAFVWSRMAGQTPAAG